MPSKGIQCYSYNAAPSCQIEFSVPGQTLNKTGQKEWTADHLEVDRKNLSGIFNFSGVFRCRVLRVGEEIFNKYVKINTFTGNIRDGNMQYMTDQISVFVKGVDICFSFYDAPSKPVAGLPIWDQFYISVTENNEKWLSDIAPVGSQAAAQPFSRLVLPAAHDIGMNSMSTATNCVKNANIPFLNEVRSFIPSLSAKSDRMLSGYIPDIIQGLSITQKDSLSTILALGARYFEFRPAYLPNQVRRLVPIPDKLYFMHGPIPGMEYEEFLCGCLKFLVDHPGEIIVVQLRWDGVFKDCERPTAQYLQGALNSSLKSSGSGIQVGSLSDMQNLSIDQLRSQQKQFILLENVDTYSSYTDQANATLTGDGIVSAFNQMQSSNQVGKAFTNLQCQATATNLKKVVIFSVMNANVSNSCLLCTKAVCDNKTMPWIQKNALAKLTAEQNIVIMDDFFDGAICDLAKDMSLQRLGSRDAVLDKSKP
jgi:hypothetical protein